MILNWSSIKFFGDNKADLLDKESTEELINRLENKWELNVDIGFKTPGFKYFKFLRNDDFENLRKYHHRVTANWGINPIWCLWLTTINGVKYNLYINFATRQIIWSRHRFDPELYVGTLFEGEMIESTFYIWDILIHKQKKVKTLKYNLNRRIDVIRGMLDHQYTKDSLIENVNLVLREHVTYKHIRSYINKLLENPPFKTKTLRGVSLVPIGRSLKIYNLIWSSNRANELENISGEIQDKLDPNLDYDPKPIPTTKMVFPEDFNQINKTNDDDQDFTMDFWLSPVNGSPDNYWQFIYDYENKLLKRVGMVITTTKERSLEIRELFKNQPKFIKSNIRDLLKFKCRYVNRFARWEPISLIPQQNIEN
tara:strand:- start:50 stop:1150 length:1101 start_codon:yes stop_codon:yes gene_type:complete